MTVKELYASLDYVDHSREKRLKMAQLLSSKPHLIEPLLEIAFDTINPVSSKAFWVLEFTTKNNLNYLFPYIDTFIDNLGKLKFESSIRPAAKICELLMICYFSKKQHDCQFILDERRLEKVTTACFDWLIGEHKVATKAYSMTSLMHLGKKFSWVHPELVLILEQNYASGSAAYKARARHTLEQLRKLNAAR
ncbi:adenylosuccinate lyase [Muriicola sp. Z0-33]|uniref:adenylosuccinate lyase n=1 Tax=Muriicola sp. Z0-33 TaxID=2816957 RepID=UPI002236FC93|nr:adenylosuccinate lyase [Muriicola sp. Z0-33]MCW5517091.1 adenylosuccinate lyase [Muriicola sp. Z0-33]